MSCLIMFFQAIRLSGSGCLHLAGDVTRRGSVRWDIYISIDNKNFCDL